jgi:hypothetical protein
VALEDTAPGEYPLAARCLVCGVSVLRLDCTADWAHFDELQAELADRLAVELEGAGVGLVAVLLADRLGIWVVDVRRLMPRLEADGRAEWRAGLWYSPRIST